MICFRHLRMCAWIFIAVLSFISACSGKQETAISTMQDLTGIVSMYTSGVVGSQSEITVRFVDPVPTEVWQQNASVFSFSPAIEGKQSWADNRTVVFRPDRKLENGAGYSVRFDLAKVRPDLPNSGVFEFAFEVIQQDFDVEIDPLGPDTESPGSMRQMLTGHVVTADEVLLEDVRKMIEVRVNGEIRTLRWTRESRTKYTFTVTGIQREAQPGRVMVLWNGEAIGSVNRGQRLVMVPSNEMFQLSDVSVTRGATPTIELTFSDLLDESQQLRGLIVLVGQAEPGYVIRNNVISVYPRSIGPGTYTLQIASAVRNRDGKRLEADITESIAFGSHRPAVRLIGSGVILTRNTQLLLPFEAVNLGAVDVQVTRIFENNITQFFQNNTLSGFFSLYQVGRPVANAVIPLHTLGETSINRWNSYALDLSAIMTPDPGAIYRITVGFRQHQSLFPCENTAAVAPQNRSWVQDPQTEMRYWDQFDNFWIQGSYNWNDRENPCTSSYYSSSRRVSRNAFASELGLIAKRSGTGDVHVVVTDLTTARPLRGIQFDILDYQQQLLAQGSSDDEGQWSVTQLPLEPFLLIASRGTERGYLRLDDATSLSMSDFDVAGARISDGIKGFIYAERDVWRPGDSLFVNLILDATEQNFPKNHPVNFELMDPSGSVVARRVVQGVDRMYAFATRTPVDAVTGRWMVQARAGGALFSKNLNIETIMPNRLRIDLKLDAEELRGEKVNLSGEIRSEWLHGAISGALQTDVNVTLQQGRLTFSDHTGYTFADPLISMESPQSEIFRGRLDETGVTRFSKEFERMSVSPGLIVGTLQTRVFEESGNFSTVRSQFRYIPFTRLVGIRIPGIDPQWAVLDRERTANVEIIVVDPSGRAIANRDVTLTLSELGWRWWWQRGSENLSQFYAGRNLRSIHTVTQKTNATGTLTIEIPADRLDWGRYLVRVTEGTNGHSAGMVFYSGWSEGGDASQSPQRLALDLDKQNYTTGDQITVRFPGSAQGRALISLESGSRVLRTFWADTHTGVNQITFPATEAMSPNVYATVHVIQPNAQRDNDLPIRLYGSIPILVDNPRTRLQPIVVMPSEMRPESQSQIQVKEASGRRMTYTVAIVDEGLLDITNFKTPQPHDHFYAREALGVRTWDMYNEVSGTYAGSINRILAIGGDLEINSTPDDTEITRFKPMVRVIGPFTLEAGRTAVHTISVPNYVGSVRTMIVAAQDGAFGNAEFRTPVRQPVMVLGTLPRVLSPGESVTLPVSVFAMGDNVRSVDVSVLPNALFTITGASGSRQTAVFDRPGSLTQRFQMNVAERTGNGAVLIEARSGSERASDEINIVVRNPSVPVTRLYEKAIAPGESWDIDFDPVGLAGTNQASLEISGIPPIDLSRRLRLLNQYPHANLEFRISATFPYLFLDKLTRADDNQKADAISRIQFLITSMEQFRTPTGGLSYWPGSRAPNEWVTAYALHFLVEAEKAGYFVPSALKQGLVQHLVQSAANWRLPSGVHARNDIVQAYRLYTLALSGNPAMGAMNRLRESQNLSLQARWRLALAYFVAGNPEAADALTRTASTQLDLYNDLWDCFCSSERDRAMILEALSIMNRPEMAVRLMQEVSRSLSSQDWMSTQSVAFSFIAAARFVEKSPISEQMQVNYAISSMGDGSIQGIQPVTQVPIPIAGTESQSVRVVNRGNGVVFARVSQTGVPMMDNLSAAANGLSLSVRYSYPNGEEVDPVRLIQGSDLIAEVRISNTANRGVYRQIALNQIFPSGWEIANNRMHQIPFSEGPGGDEHRDIRDDRVITYLNLNPGQTRIVSVRLTATYEGRFYLPPVSAYALYDNSINALVPGKWVEVVRN